MPVSGLQDGSRGRERMERIWDRKEVLLTPVGFILFKLFTEAWNSRTTFTVIASLVITSRLKELIVPKMPSLINCKFQACFARVMETFSSIWKPVAFWKSCTALLILIQSGALRHYSAVQNFCGSLCLRGHVIAEQRDSLKHLASFLKFCCEPSAFWQWKMLMLIGTVLLWRALGPSAVVLAALA